MTSALLLEQAKQEGWTDEQVVERVLAGEKPLYEILMRRHNQRLFRVARAILRNDAEAEDVMQDAYVRAYQHLEEFEGRAKFSTWLTRIAVHEALARSRRHARFSPLDESGAGRNNVEPIVLPDRDPEQKVADSELNHLLETAILGLPKEYRTVFVMREVEEMSTAETAECLDLTQENIKVRLHRARALLRKKLSAQLQGRTTHALQFQAQRCDRVVQQVFRRLAAEERRPDKRTGDKPNGGEIVQ